MPLTFPGKWRFTPPADGAFHNRAVPDAVILDALTLVEKIRLEQNRKWTYEHFKKAFGATNQSTTEDWAYSDLRRAMESAADNAPTFIESLYDGCESLRQLCEDWFIPDHSFINTILATHRVGYQISPPDLIAREVGGPLVTVITPPPSLDEQARSRIDRSLKRSEELLVQGHSREAVQELLWLLETVSTAFRGFETESGTVEGKYFGKIVGDLQKKLPGTTLTSVLNWITTMHGYLSAPAGGGIRHGLDLGRGVDLTHNQAKLFCDLTRSYISFLLGEFDFLSRTGASHADRSSDV